MTGQRVHTRLGQRLPHRFLVIDDKPEMTAVVGSLPAAFLKREELIAEIDESLVLALAAQFEVKQASVECERLFNVADLDRDMVETNGTRLLCSAIRGLQPSVSASCGAMTAPTQSVLHATDLGGFSVGNATP